MAGITVIPGQNPYAGWGQAMSQAVQGWSNNRMRNQMLQGMGNQHPMAQMVRGLPYEQAAQLMANYTQNQQMNPLQQSQIDRNEAYSRYLDAGGKGGRNNYQFTNAQKMQSYHQGEVNKAMEVLRERPGDERVQAMLTYHQGRVRYFNSIMESMTGGQQRGSQQQSNHLQGILQGVGGVLGGATAGPPGAAAGAAGGVGLRGVLRNVLAPKNQPPPPTPKPYAPSIKDAPQEVQDKVKTAQDKADADLATARRRIAAAKMTAPGSLQELQTLEKLSSTINNLSESLPNYINDAEVYKEKEERLTKMTEKLFEKLDAIEQRNIKHQINEGVLEAPGSGNIPTFTTRAEVDKLKSGEQFYRVDKNGNRILMTKK